MRKIARAPRHTIAFATEISRAAECGLRRAIERVLVMQPADKIDYDGAGRVQHWTTPDAKIDYDGFTLDGLPQSTTQTRFRNQIVS